MSGPAKPLTGPGRDTQLIFDRPELQARRHRWVYSTITLVAWVIWMYLWLPVITLIAWYFGVRTFLREVMIPQPGTLLTLTVVYLLVIATLGVLLIGWSRYNLGRFGGEDRRRAPRALPDEDVLEWFGIDAEDLRWFRTTGTIAIDWTEGGELTGARGRPHSPRPEEADPVIEGTRVVRPAPAGPLPSSPR